MNSAKSGLICMPSKPSWLYRGPKLAATLFRPCEEVVALFHRPLWIRSSKDSIAAINSAGVNAQ